MTWFRSVFILVTVLSGAAVTTADAVTIDGHVDADYGPALSIQAVQTGFDDTPPEYPVPDSLQMSSGSELDVAHGFVSSGVLYLFFGGNLRNAITEPLILPDQLEIFIDCVAGGQNQLRSDNPSVGFYLRLPELAGLTFDADFAPDYWFSGFVERRSEPLFAFYAELPEGGAGAGYWLGRAAGGGPGTLSGGTNPFGVLASLEQGNRAGVTAGCAAASGSGVTTGVEFAIPLAAIGNPTGPIKVCAFIDGRGRASLVSNQVLGPLPPGTCPLGEPGGVDFASVPGTQWFTIDPPTQARTTSWGRLKALYR